LTPSTYTLDTWLLRPVPAAAKCDVSGREDLAVANSCGYDILLHLYKTPIEALQQPAKRRGDHRGGRYKGIDMTLQGLYSFFNPGVPFDASQLGLTLPQFKMFFERLNLQLTVLDVAGAEVIKASFQPTHQNRKISPWHVWVLHHDGHLFLLNAGLHAAKMATFRPSLLGRSSRWSLSTAAAAAATAAARVVDDDRNTLLWYPDNETPWTEAGCKSFVPPTTTHEMEGNVHGDRPHYPSRQGCCMASYPDQPGNVCIGGIVGGLTDAVVAAYIETTDGEYLVDVVGVTNSSSYILQNELPALHIFGVGLSTVEVTDVGGMQRLVDWLRSPASQRYRVWLLGFTAPAVMTEG
jgi:hypothetical protein